MKKFLGIILLTIFLTGCGGGSSYVGSPIYETYNWMIAEAYYHENGGCKIHSIKNSGSSNKTIIGPTSGSDVYKGSGTNESSAKERALTECEWYNSSSNQVAEKPKKKQPKKKQPKVKKVKPEDLVPAASGTGFFVSRSGHIITNFHVIEGCDANKLSYKGKSINTDTIAVDKTNDLAILKAKLNPNRVYSVSNNDASLLEDIIIAGYPLGKKVSAAIKTSKGSITALAGYGDNYSEFQTDAALNQGNSGGPIMNQKGNVVGVAVANYGKKSGIESFNFGIKSSTLKTFASANGLKFLPPNNRDLSNKELGNLITEATIYLECHMTVAKIRAMIKEANNRKAFFSEHQ